jgi:DNA adenine methylase
VLLPRDLRRVGVPPIKSQGIKTKLVRFILKNIVWNGKGKYIEPFLGSGVVLFNLAPERAIAAEINPHIISFYRKLQTGELQGINVRSFLEREGQLLSSRGEEYYYEVRKRFNSRHDPLDLLFLNRSCFNGVMRFNSKGKFNVPFCKKPNRFRKAYITKIVNQVKWVSNVIKNRDWRFTCADWKDTLDLCDSEDFVYLDPPYYGRHTNYIGYWTEEDMTDLIKTIKALPCGYALSLWKSNVFRTNPMIEEFFNDHIVRTFNHEYFVGSTVNLRHKMDEALIIKPNYAVMNQPTLFDFAKATN